MRFNFDANQEYQLTAIEAVTDLFEGQVVTGSEFQLRADDDFTAVANRLDLDEETLLANLGVVQSRNRIKPDTELKCITQTIEVELLSNVVF